MKKSVIIVGSILFLSFILYFISRNSYIKRTDYSGVMEENPSVKDAYFNKLLADPATGKIPAHIRALELAYDRTLPVFQGLKRSYQWTQRGPDNLGGRTRAIGINVSNLNEMLAGAATGGIFKSLDGGRSWFRTQCPLLSITCMVQDQRPGKTSIWYAGTGELTGSSGSAKGSYYYGAGILKSTDGGSSWNILPSTAGVSKNAFDKDFDGVWNLAIDNSNLTEDEIYASAYGTIYRSVNGGVSWQAKLTGSLTSSYYTDVAITSTGIVYATLSSEGAKKGIWRSPDGLIWANIIATGFPSTYGRTVIGIAPSDENQVYFLAAGTNNAGFLSTNFLGVKEWNSLWKYTYVSGTGSGTGGTWENRSQNLPDKGGDFGYFSTQGGYDLFVKVKPDDANAVFLGVTNLWRSTDGFATGTKTDWIGGYAVNTFRPDFKMYSNHHPDQHNFIFYPGSTSKVFSVHDGGISLTENIMAPSVIWSAMNHNYITSQFYTVAIDHATPMDNKIIGGLQDNGTYFQNKAGLGPWEMSLSSDGSFCFVKDGTNEIYASTQQGRIMHLEVNATGMPVKYARIDPSQLYRSDYDFINPYSIDPNNPKILYLPARKRLFRNTDIEAKVLSSTYDSTRWTTPLWEELIHCVPPTGEFSAITTSRSNSNTMYYATDAGKLFKVSNAHTGQPKPVNISGTNFGAGSINCIALDPLDSNRIMVVFSNYNVISLFATEDGGKIWTDVSGNLEENANGSGAGPSCRWAAVMHLQNGKRTWFVGTSTGLFASGDLKATPVVWIKQSPDGIGSAIVSMIDIRLQDYYIVAATHGAGVYSANIANEWQTTSVKANAGAFKFSTYPNPLTGNIVGVSFSGQLNAMPECMLFDAAGNTKQVKLDADDLLQSNTIRLNIGTLSSGIYWLVIRSGNKQWTEKIVVLK